MPLLLAARNAFRGRLKLLTANPLHGNSATLAGWALIAIFVVIVGIAASQTVLDNGTGIAPPPPSAQVVAAKAAPKADAVVAKPIVPKPPSPSVKEFTAQVAPKVDMTVSKPPSPTSGTATTSSTINDDVKDLETTAFRGHRYQVFVEKTSWTSAKAKCEAAGGYLACVGSAAENQFLYELIERQIGPGRIGIEKNRFWLGGEVVEGSWKWITGEPWHYAPNPVQVNGKDNYLRHCGSSWIPATIHPAFVGGFVCEWDR